MRTLAETPATIILNNDLPSEPGPGLYLIRKEGADFVLVKVFEDPATGDLLISYKDGVNPLEWAHKFCFSQRLTFVESF